MAKVKRRYGLGNEPLEQRFLRYVAETDTSDPDACWPWPADESNGKRYYSISNEPGAATKRIHVHRVAHLVWIGPIPDGYEVDHVCRYRSCINPRHLEAVTLQENRRRRNEAKTHCSKGHRYEDCSFTMMIDNEGYAFRRCNACFEAAQRRYREKHLPLGTPRVHKSRSHCSRGHEFTPDSVYLSKQLKSDGTQVRRCKICIQAAVRKREGR